MSSRRRQKKQRERLTDDEEEEEQKVMQYSSNSQRLRKSKKNQFFEDEAEESEDEEEAEEEEEYMNDEDYITSSQQYQSNNRQKQQQQLSEYTLEPRKMSKMEFLSKEEDELEAEVLKRYEAAREDDQQYVGTVETQLDKLPTLKDPRLFGVKCYIGMEKEVIRRLMNKYYCLMNTPEELQIISVSSVFKQIGYIYIEAYYEAHVRHALQGIQMVNSNKVFVVPLKEMPQIFAKTIADKVDIRQDQYVRIKVGLYKDDLAKVDIIDPETNIIKCLVVPRITQDETNNIYNEQDYQQENINKKKKGSFKSNAFSNEKTRPPQKLMPSTERMYRDGTDFIYGNKRFRNGYLVKDFYLHQLQTNNVMPTIEELKMFKFLGGIVSSSQQQEDNKEQNTLLSLIDDSSGLQCNVNIFQKGDKVKVIKGELRNLGGRVVNVIDNLVRIESLNEELPDTMDIDPNDLEKYFQKGDHVKVLNGKFEGQTGTVLTVSDSVATIISEDMQHEFQVRINDIQLSGEINNITQYQNSFKKYDLVKLNDFQEVGIIISLLKDSCNLVNTEATIQNVKYQQIDHKLNTKRNIISNGNQEIQQSSTVKVIDGINKGRRCTVVHVFHDVLFLQNNEAMHTGGILVEKVTNCILITTVTMNNTNLISRFEQINQNFGEMNTSRISSQQQQQNQKIQTRDKIHEFIGKEISINKGGWKGYKGIVKDINEKVARIELFSKFKTISVPRTDIKLTSDTYDYTYTSGAKTPLHPQISGSSPFIETSPGWEISPSYDSNVNR